MTIQAQRSTRGATFKSPVASSSGATHFASVDTFVGGVRADYAVVDVLQGPAAATDTSSKWTSLQLMHGTTTDVSNATAVTGPFVGTTEATATTSQFVLPEHNDTDEESCVRFYVDIRNLERFLGIQGQQDNTSNLSWFQVEFWRGDGMGETAAKRGVAAFTEG